MTLDAADYYLEDWPDVCRFERKASLSELFGNLFTKDRTRQFTAFQKLADSCAHPYILVEKAPAQLYDERCYAGKGEPPPPGAIFDRLCDAVARFGLSIVFAGASTPHARRLTGEFIVRTMLRYAVAKELDL